MVDDHAMDIAQLVADHHQVVYRYAYRLTGSVPDAEDLTQQVFLTAQEKSGQLRSAKSARSWLLTILRNYFLKSCQKRRPIPADHLQLNMNTIPAEIPESASIDRERLQGALGELPPNYRVVLAMFYFEGLSYREIAERLEVPMGTVMSRLARAKGHLRSKLIEADRSPAVGPRHQTLGHGG
ncbi:MAG: RNA polymerase sigma factor [Planctomycetota bacterium]|jgi:RNA polymerase sigma-70 factor (ECF subfamily)